MILAFVCLLALLPECRGRTVTHVGCMVEMGLEREAMRQAGDDTGDPELEDSPPGDTTNRRGPFRTLVVGETDSLTVQVCVEHCWLQKYDYAAMQAGHSCYCSHTIFGLSLLNDTACYEHCGGNCNQRCGAAIALSVYDTAYLGCYLSSSVEQLCTQKPGDGSNKEIIRSGRMTAVVCVLYCLSPPGSRQVAVVMSRDTCCCGMDAMEAQKLERDRQGVLCKITCAGSDEPCVGLGRVSAYDLASWRFPSELTETQLEDFFKQSGWLWPNFPVEDDFEIKDDRAEMEAREEEAAQAEILDVSAPKLSRPVIEPDNAGVAVVDEPEEEEGSGSSVGLIIGIVICCLVVTAGMIFVFQRTYKQKKDGAARDTEKAIILKEDTTDDSNVNKAKETKMKKTKTKQKKTRENDVSSLSESTADENETLL